MTESVPLSQRRRRPRVDEKTIKDRMFNAARELVTEQQLLTASLDDLSVEDVIKKADVPRASAYRIWPYRADFLGDLLVQLARPSWFGTGAFDETTLRSAADVLLEHYAVLEDPKSSADERRAIIREATRVGATRNFEYLTTSEAWRMYTALSATASVVKPDEVRCALALALQESDWTFTNTMAFFYSEMASFGGFRLSHPSYSWTQVAAAGAAAVEGLGLRHQFGVGAWEEKFETSGPEDGDLPKPWLHYVERLLTSPVHGPGLTPAGAEWHLAAYSFVSIFEGFVTYLEPAEFTPRPRQDVLDLLAGLDAIKTENGTLNVELLQGLVGPADDSHV